MDPVTRRWWALFDSLPERIARVTCWRDAGPLPKDAPGHVHMNPTSVACLDGVVRITRPGASIDLHPGDMLLISAGIWHHHAPLRRGSVWFGQGFLPAWSDVILGDHEREWHGRMPSQPSRNLMDAAFAASDGPRQRTLLADLVRQVLGESVQALDFEHPALQRMIALLWSRLHLGLTAEDLVRASGMSRARAYAVFTAGFGVPPKKAIATGRLWLAESLLATGAAIGEVARLAGYPSADTFARAWRRAYGRPPRDSRPKGK